MAKLNKDEMEVVGKLFHPTRTLRYWCDMSDTNIRLLRILTETADSLYFIDNYCYDFGDVDADGCRGGCRLDGEQPILDVLYHYFSLLEQDYERCDGSDQELSQAMHGAAHGLHDLIDILDDLYQPYRDELMETIRDGINSMYLRYRTDNVIDYQIAGAIAISLDEYRCKKYSVIFDWNRVCDYIEDALELEFGSHK